MYSRSRVSLLTLIALANGPRLFCLAVQDNQDVIRRLFPLRVQVCRRQYPGFVADCCNGKGSYLVKSRNSRDKAAKWQSRVSTLLQPVLEVKRPKRRPQANLMPHAERLHKDFREVVNGAQLLRNHGLPGVVAF